MTCPLGCGDDYTRHGKDRHGRQRYRCGGCGRTFMEPQPPRLLGDMRISEDKAILALHMLAEGNSIRGVEAHDWPSPRHHHAANWSKLATAAGGGWRTVSSMCRAMTFRPMRFGPMLA